MANEITIVVGAKDQTKVVFDGVRTSSVAMGAAFGVVAAQMARDLTGMAKSAFMVGLDFNAMKEQATIAFTSMLGSGRRAKTFLDELQAFAAKTPFEFPDLLEGSQRLLAMGFAADDLIPTMTSLGDAAAAMGGDSVMIDRLTLALGQMLAKGKVSGEEMRQFAEAGIPAWDMLAQKMGISIPEAMKLSEKGAIDAATGIAALTEGMDQRFGGMMAKQATTYSGLVSTLKDNARIFAAEVTEPLFDDMKEALAGFMSWFEQNRDRIKAVFQSIISTVQAFVGHFIEGLKVVLAAGKFFFDFWTQNKPMMIAAITAIGVAIFLALGPVSQAALAITAMIVAIGYLRDNWRTIANGIIGIVEGMANGIIDGLNKALNKIGDFLEKVRSVPGLGDILGLGGMPSGQILEGGGIGKVTLGRLATPASIVDPLGAGGAAREIARIKGLGDAMNEATFDANALATSLGGAGGGGAAGAARELTNAEKALEEARRSLFETITRIQNDFLTEQVEAYLRGGQAQVDIVKGQQQEMYAAARRTAQDLMQTFGVDLPTALDMAMSHLKTGADEMRRAVEEATKKIDDLRYAAYQGSLNPQQIGAAVNEGSIGSGDATRLLMIQQATEALNAFRSGSLGVGQYESVAIAQGIASGVFSGDVGQQILNAIHGIPGFATGGMVGGPLGAPRLAVVHGGEEVRTPAQQRAGGGTSLTVNVTVEGSIRSERELGQDIVTVVRNAILGGGFNDVLAGAR